MTLTPSCYLITKQEIQHRNLITKTAAETADWGGREIVQNRTELASTTNIFNVTNIYHEKTILPKHH